MSDFGQEDTIALLKWNNQVPAFNVRLRYRTLAGLKEQFDNEEISLTPGRYLEEYIQTNRLQPILQKGLVKDGYAVVHDESAGLVVALLQPQPDELICRCLCSTRRKSAVISMI